MTNQRPIMVDKEGAMTLPKAVRTALQITDRAQLTYEVRDGGVFLQRAITIPAEDAWAYTPEESAAIERARHSPLLPHVGEDDLIAIMEADDPQAAARALIAKHLNA